MTEIIQPVVLCGGAGTRLWPLSRLGFPKQFLCLTGSESLFQQTSKRLMGLGSDDLTVAKLMIVAGQEHRFLVSEQLRECGIEFGAALLEPVGRNTAPALTLAALAATLDGLDPVMVVTPSDQAITDAGAFNQAVQAAVREALGGNIVILGVTPDTPETGYGYIKASPAIEESVMSVQRFVEKPKRATAKHYLAEGSYYWNAGIFVLRASVWLKTLEEFRPDILDTTAAAWEQRSVDANLAGRFVRPGDAEFNAIPAESIDCAVMERLPGSCQSLYMVPLNAGWSDMGSWEAVWQALPQDAQGNAHLGDVLTTDSQRTLVHASGRLVTLVGVQDLVVIETPDVVLVADRTRSQDIKQIVGQLQQAQRAEQALHRKVHRPWGWYDIVDEGDRFKVKRIQVRPGASLSLQKHHHRAEHWVVVKGVADITNGGTTLHLTENQSTYIPLGSVHRLANPGSTSLEIIEVQSGDYLGEDDIVRLEDTYGRINE
ncbi:mannose-1-phosphate guanylyltransferase/mannose-6-phosphate isomerase [Alphaproteobacteria bacterium]|nr:mannose-1-phosphate guanylyltransferase/mannose-6-phosphate isomerase [Alphaproteobacteria bacterium]